MAKLNYYFGLRHRNKPGSLGVSDDGSGAIEFGLDTPNGTPEIKLNAGAWTPMPVINGVRKYYSFWTGLAAGDHSLYYRDAGGERLIGTFKIWSWTSEMVAEGCRYTANVGGGPSLVAPSPSIITFDSFIYIQLAVNYNPSPYALQATLAPGGATDIKQSNSQNRVTFQQATIAAYLTPGGTIPNLYYGKSNSPGCMYLVGEDILFKDLNNPLAATYTKTDVTVFGGDDGTITLNVTGGSGVYTYLWNDGVTTKDRVDLVAGPYTVTITDTITLEEVVLNIFINEPGDQNPTGTFLEVPQMNSISYIINQNVDDCSNPQGLDNVLLCNQVYEGFDQTNYFQKVNKCDPIITQFNSDFRFFDIALRRYDDGTPIKYFDFVMKEQNIGVTEDYGVVIRDHEGINQSRVYFNVGPPPIPLIVGSSVQILNSVDGYDGIYEMVDVLTDTTLGYQFFVINKNFVGPGSSSSATGRFDASTVDFNVFEFIADFLDVPDGEYYFTILANDGDGESLNTIEAVSEPIDLQVNHPGTVLIKARNNDNAFGITWTTGYIITLRIPAHFGNRRFPGGERSVNRNSNYKLVKINAKKTRGIELMVWEVPPYLHEKLSVVFDMDSYSINGHECQSNEGYGEPEYVDQYLLANSSIKVEVVWFDNYNSDDIGPVADGGYIATETGFLLR